MSVANLKIIMAINMQKLFFGAVAGLVATAFSVSFTVQAEHHDEVISKVMKDFHKAPKGVDPVSKKAGDGKATKEELKKLVEGYKAMAKAKPAKGTDASWKEKMTKLVAASEGLEKGLPDAAAKFKEAVNCKACHSEHKPD